MKFRKKPVVIEAARYSGYLPELPEQFQDAIARCLPGGNAWIATLEGDMQVSIGDWIIKGVNGEYYPCKPDIFAKTYEPVDS